MTQTGGQRGDSGDRRGGSSSAVPPPSRALPSPQRRSPVPFHSGLVLSCPSTPRVPTDTAPRSPRFRGIPVGSPLSPGPSSRPWGPPLSRRHPSSCPSHQRHTRASSSSPSSSSLGFGGPRGDPLGNRDGKGGGNGPGAPPDTDRTEAWRTPSPVRWVLDPVRWLLTLLQLSSGCPHSVRSRFGCSQPGLLAPSPVSAGPGSIPAQPQFPGPGPVPVRSRYRSRFGGAAPRPHPEAPPTQGHGAFWVA